MPEVADEKRALVALRAGIGTVPGAGPQENSGALQARPCQRQVDLDRYDISKQYMCDSFKF